MQKEVEKYFSKYPNVFNNYSNRNLSEEKNVDTLPSEKSSVTTTQVEEEIDDSDVNFINKATTLLKSYKSQTL